MDLGLTARLILFYTYTRLLQQKNIGVTELAKILETSKPNISQIVNQLNESKYVEKRPYKPISLTNSGLIKADQIYQRVLLIESFLFKSLAMPFSQCRTEAFQWEQNTYTSTIHCMKDKINLTVGLLGEIIPNKIGQINSSNTLFTLNRIEPGTPCVISAFSNTHIDNSFLSELSKIYLESVIIAKQDSITNSILIICNQNKFILPYELAKNIFVTV